MKLAVAQLRVKGGQLDANLSRAERAIDDAATGGAELFTELGLEPAVASSQPALDFR
jgi:predicted amidohydrolase